MNKLVYQKAKEMLTHRSGTEYEDMYWIDMKRCEVLCSKLNETNTSEIRHTKAIDKKIKECESVLAIHTHPHSMPPSAEDFNSFVKAGYKMGIIVCHNGTIYRYGANKEISEKLMMLYINKFYLKFHDELKAQLNALNKLVSVGDIYYEEIRL